MKDLPEAKKARNSKWNKERLPESERCQKEIELGRSLPKRILRSALDRFLKTGSSKPKPKPLPAPGVVDLTPISQTTIDYWTSQGYVSADVQDDPLYQAEILQANKEQIEKHSEPFDPDKFGPKDPSHPYAYTPRYVTFKMRRNQQFRCHVMGWHETEWVRNKITGEIRPVGKLTRDHTKAATHGGATSHDNMKMVAALVNRKKGHKHITYEQLRDHIVQFWEVFHMSENERFALNHFIERGVRHITL